MKHFAEILQKLFEEWGQKVTRPPKGKPGPRLALLLQTEPGKAVEVATLTHDGQSFVFRYSEEFRRSGLPAVPSFPDLTREKYESPILWPFFQVRLPPGSREDVARVVREHHLGEDDVFERLTVLGRRAIASPYEVKLMTA